MSLSSYQRVSCLTFDIHWHTKKCMFVIFYNLYLYNTRSKLYLSSLDVKFKIRYIVMNFLLSPSPFPFNPELMLYVIICWNIDIILKKYCSSRCSKFRHCLKLGLVVLYSGEGGDLVVDTIAWSGLTPSANAISLHKGQDWGMRHWQFRLLSGGHFLDSLEVRLV